MSIGENVYFYVALGRLVGDIYRLFDIQKKNLPASNIVYRLCLRSRLNATGNRALRGLSPRLIE